MRVQGVYVSDMIAHNNDRDRDVFQIAPGTSRASLWLAEQAQIANDDLERIGAGVEPAVRSARAARAAGAARTAPPCPKMAAAPGP